MKGVVFDIDGTLVDSRERHALVLRYALDKNGLAAEGFDAAAFLAFKREGGSSKDFLRHQMKLSEKYCNMVASCWVEHIEDEFFLRSDTLYPDSLYTLKKVKEEGYAVHILTARQNASAVKKQIEGFSLGGYVDDVVVVSPKNAVVHKKDALLCWKDTILSIGDSEVDYNAAKAAECAFFALSRGFRSQSYWKKLGVLSHEDFSELFLYI